MKRTLFILAVVAIAFVACKNGDEPSNNNANTPASTVVPGELTGEFSVGANNYNDNAYMLSEWAQMEAAGAVFLSVASNRDGAAVSTGGLGKFGGYWSSTLSGTVMAKSMKFLTYYLYPQVGHNRSNSLAVRLVR